MTYEWGHRPALTGLRTIAVYLVVAFHADVALFEGGFIGVDLFFVLSGFLVCQVLHEELESHGGIRFARFYARRFRRLLPAALAAIVGTSLMMVGLAPLFARSQLVADAQAALVYVANWYYVVQARDYFAGEGLESPFLHFWSLSLEEQYYLLFPLVLAVAFIAARRRRSPSLVLWVLAVPFVVSVALQVALRGDVSRSYYGTDTRLYQPLAGALLATWLRVRGRLPEVAPWVGPAAVAVAVVALVAVSTPLVGTPSAAVRGFAATTISVVVIGGLELSLSAWPTRALSTGPMTYLGDISYGTYLWHWPVIIALGLLVDVSPLTMAVVAGLLATALAALSHRLLEEPIRRGAALHRIPRTVVASGLAVSVLAAVLVVPGLLRIDSQPVVLAGFGGVEQAEAPIAATPGATTNDDVPDDEASRDPAGSGEASEDDVDAGRQVDLDSLDLEAASRKRARWGCVDAEPSDCVLVEGSGLHVHVIGDSHAGALVPALRRMAGQHDLTLSATTRGSCPWQRHLYVADRSESSLEACRRHKEDAYDRVIPALDPDVVVAHGRALDTPEWRAEREPPTTDDEAAAAAPFVRTTRSTIRALAGDGMRVVVVEPVPEAPFHPLHCLSAVSDWTECAFLDDNGELDSELLFDEVAADRSRVATVDLDTVVCPELPRCGAVVNAQVVRADPHHLAMGFSRSIAGQVHERLVGTSAWPDG